MYFARYRCCCSKRAACLQTWFRSVVMTRNVFYYSQTFPFLPPPEGLLNRVSTDAWVEYQASPGSLLPGSSLFNLPPKQNSPRPLQADMPQSRASLIQNGTSASVGYKELAWLVTIPLLGSTLRQRYGDDPLQAICTANNATLAGIGPYLGAGANHDYRYANVWEGLTVSYGFLTESQLDPTQPTLAALPSNAYNPSLAPNALDEITLGPPLPEYRIVYENLASSTTPIPTTTVQPYDLTPDLSPILDLTDPGYLTLLFRPKTLLEKQTYDNTFQGQGVFGGTPTTIIHTFGPQTGGGLVSLSGTLYWKLPHLTALSPHLVRLRPKTLQPNLS